MSNIRETHEYIGGGRWLDKLVRLEGGQAAVDEVIRTTPCNTDILKEDIWQHYGLNRVERPKTLIGTI